MNTPNPLYRNLRFIASNLIFEYQPDMIGRIIRINRKSFRIDKNIQSEVETFCNLNISLVRSKFRKRAIKKYGYLELTFILSGVKMPICANPIEILRKEEVIKREKHESPEELEDARGIMSSILEDDIATIKSGEVYLKIFGEARGNFISQYDLFQQEKSKKEIRSIRNAKMVEFEIIDACITNLSSIWFQKHFYL